MYALGIDFGGGSGKATLIDERGRVVATASSEYPTDYGGDGRAEQDPEDWYRAACANICAVLGMGFRGEDIACICFDAATHTAVLTDGQFVPVAPAIYWTDTRSYREKAFLEERYGDEIFRKCRHRVDTVWSLPEILYLKNNFPEAFARVRKVVFAKDYVRRKFTGDFVTDRIEAEGSMLLDFDKKEWDEHLLGIVGLRKENMPRIVEPMEEVGTVLPAVARETGLSERTKVICGATDTVMEVFAAGGVNKGDMTVKLATAGRICTVDDRIYPDKSILNYSHLKSGLYYPGSGTKSAAASLRWLRDTFGGSYREFDGLAAEVPAGSGGLLFHPYLRGEITPYSDPLLRGGFLGVSAEHGKGHFARAVMEGVAMSLLDCKRYLLEKGVRLGGRAYAIGGGAKSDLWRQILADVLDLVLVTTENNDSSFGSAVCAAVAAGFFSTLDEGIRRCGKKTGETYPDPARTQFYGEMFVKYKRAAAFYAEFFHEK